MEIPLGNLNSLRFIWAGFQISSTGANIYLLGEPRPPRAPTSTSLWTERHLCLCRSRPFIRGQGERCLLLEQIDFQVQRLPSLMQSDLTMQRHALPTQPPGRLQNSRANSPWPGPRRQGFKESKWRLKDLVQWWSSMDRHDSDEIHWFN